MMFWYDHDVSGWGWFAMSFGMIAFWVLIITVAVLALRTVGRASERPTGPTGSRPEQVLAERFARGEIDEEEYQKRLHALRASGGSPGT
ncbi:SHOCT domain-containing protein [Streptomyces fradiae]|uniref:SHOCT domain-containing protein n=1 Tax=Streptomyces fradiae TaxID=1906 RepID=UPI003669DC7E